MKSKSSASESFEIEVLNIPITLTEEEARRFFLQYGKILSITLQPFTRRCFVAFSTKEAREKAVQMANG
jgi:RNA recognition motif-containing protein